MLALLLAEAALLRETRGEAPILLLDDVLSELDAGRRARLLALLPAHGQAVVTAADAEGVPGPDLVLRVEAGARRADGPVGSARGPIGELMDDALPPERPGAGLVPVCGCGPTPWGRDRPPRAAGPPYP